MDLFEELGKQTAKILDSVNETMDELSSFVVKSADSVGSILVLRGKLESAKTDLSRLYRQVGKNYCDEPQGNHQALLEEIGQKQQAIAQMEAEIETLKKKILETGGTLKTSAQQTLSDMKDSAVAVKDQAVQDFYDEADAVKKAAGDTVENIKGDAEVITDQAKADAEAFKDKAADDLGELKKQAERDLSTTTNQAEFDARVTADQAIEDANAVKKQAKAGEAEADSQADTDDKLAEKQADYTVKTIITPEEKVSNNF